MRPERNSENKSEHHSEHHLEHHDHSEHHHEPDHPPVPGGPCPVETTSLLALANSPTTTVHGMAVNAIKVPVVTAEPTIQITVEADIKLHPAATEIKRVKKNVFLNQVKLVPVKFKRIDNTDFFNVQKGKLFVAGHIRKNLEFASDECNGTIHDRIVDIPFTGFTELKFRPANFPILGIAESAEANFL